MSRARHKEHHRAKGGKVVAYAGGGSNVMEEAHATKNTPGRKHGGHVGDGEESKHHAGKRKRGGRMNMKHDHKHPKLGHGHHTVHPSHHEYHHRARGGAVGSDKRPLSSAAKIKFMPEERGGGKHSGPANEQTDH